MEFILEHKASSILQDQAIIVTYRISSLQKKILMIKSTNKEKKFDKI